MCVFCQMQNRNYTSASVQSQLHSVQDRALCVLSDSVDLSDTQAIVADSSVESTKYRIRIRGSALLSRTSSDTVQVDAG